MKAQSDLPTSALLGRVTDALAAGDGQLVLAEVGEVRRLKGPAEVIGTLVLPAVRELRRRRRAGEVDSVTFAAGVSIARRALMHAGDAGVAPKPGHRAVVVAGPDIDGCLEAEGAYEALVAAGHPAQLLVDVNDPELLLRHLATLRPLAVAAASADSRALPSIAGLASIAGRAGVPMIATGPAFGAAGSRAARVGATAWAQDPAGMLDVLGEWQASGGALPMNVQEPAEAALIRAAWPAVIMAAAGTGGPDEVWAQDTVRALGQLLLAAVWAADVDVLLEWLSDELAGPDRTHVRDVHLVGLLDSVAAALPPTMESAAAMLASARDDLRQRILRPGRPLRSVSDQDGVAGGQVPRPTAAGGATPPTSFAMAPSPMSTLPSTSLAMAASGTGMSAAGSTQNPSPLAVSAQPTGQVAGQAIADLLLLGALSVQATAAVVAVAQPGGRWSALAHGVEVKDGLNDPLLWNAIASRREPLEAADLTVHPEMARSPLAKQPIGMRWAYGTVLRNPDGTVAGVYCLLDRGLRQTTRREQRALAAGARQLNAQLQALRRPGGTAAPLPSMAPAVRPMAERPSRRGSSLPEGQQLLRSHEVAVLFDVTERTVINWAAAGKLPSLRTIGGHLRFRSDDVHALLNSRRAGA